MSQFDKARRDLGQWRELQPTNIFTSDRQLQRLAERFLGAESFAKHRPHFERFGAVVAGPLDDAAVVNNQVGNTPKLERWSPYGHRTESIAHHPSYDACGEAIYEDGEVIAAYGDDHPNSRALALFYLSSHAGEAGHNCPVACTAGVVKAVGAAGSDALRERYLPGLLTADYSDRLDGAQFVTEVQGGSDVGANAVLAEPDGEALGTTRWRIRGEKWFCSNADADLILMTARVAGPAGSLDGTRGLGLFLVPRLLDNGQVNHFHLRRLKDKLGTRSMPSAEIDFDGAVAYAVGPVSRGFSTLMKTVINTSRIYNTVGCAGIARRARLVATAYARSRRAFGNPIADFPLVQEMIASMRATGQAVTAGALLLANALDRQARGELSAAELQWLRVATNLAKMRSCQHSHRVVLTAIETLGGNGAIESFSVLPRLLRDNIVYENWEGTHNTLIAQTVRDFGKHKLHEGLFSTLKAQLTTGVDAVDAVLEPARAALAELQDALGPIADAGDPNVAALMLRPHAERLADVFFAAAFGADIASEPDAATQAADRETLTFFIDRFVRARPVSVDPDYVERVRVIAKLDG